MIQVHGKTILSTEFKSMIKAHDLNPWQFSYQKPSSYWQYQKNQILIGNIKSLVFAGNIIKAQFSLQHQNPILICNIKAKFLLAIFKA